VRIIPLQISLQIQSDKANLITQTFITKYVYPPGVLSTAIN